MTNWPVNPSTETFFSFQSIDACPTFMVTINDMVVAGMIHKLNTSSDGGVMAPVTGFNHDQRLASARQSAVKYIEEAQEGRLFTLVELAKSVPAGISYGVVDWVLAWNGDVVQELAPPMEAQPMSQNPSGGNIVMYGNSHAPNMSFTDPTSSSLNHAPLVDAQPMSRNFFDGNTMLHDPSSRDVVSGELTSTNANIGAPHESRSSFGRSMPLSRNATTGHSLLSNDSTVTKATSATQKSRTLASKSVLSKRPREDPADRLKAPKRVRFTNPSTQQVSRFMDAGFDVRVPIDPFGTNNQSTMQSNTDPTAALPTLSEGVLMDDWPVGDIMNDPALWPDMLPAEEFDWSTISLDDIPVQQDMPKAGFETSFVSVDLRSPQLDQAFSGAGVSFALEPLMGDMFGEPGVEERSGVEGSSDANFNLSTGASEMAQDGADPHAGADTTALSWDLPDLNDDNDEDWLKEAIEIATAMGPPEDM
jgi:hypothetical protein